jgi:hypothetical protein
MAVTFASRFMGAVRHRAVAGLLDGIALLENLRFNRAETAKSADEGAVMSSRAGSPLSAMRSCPTVRRRPSQTGQRHELAGLLPSAAGTLIATELGCSNASDLRQTPTPWSSAQLLGQTPGVNQRTCSHGSIHCAHRRYALHSWRPRVTRSARACSRSPTGCRAATWRRQKSSGRYRAPDRRVVVASKFGADAGTI